MQGTFLAGASTPLAVAALLLLLMAPAFAMSGGGGGGGSGGGGGGGAGGGSSGGMGGGGMSGGGMGSGNAMGDDMQGVMHDHITARNARQHGKAPALSQLMAQLRRRYPGSKVLDVRTERRNGRLHYIFSLMDRNNRVHRVRVPLPAARVSVPGGRRYNFNRNR